MSSDIEKDAAQEADRMEERLDTLSQHIDEAKNRSRDESHTEEEVPTGDPPDTEAVHPESS